MPEVLIKSSLKTDDKLGIHSAHTISPILAKFDVGVVSYTFLKFEFLKMNGHKIKKKEIEKALAYTVAFCDCASLDVNVHREP